MNCFVGDNRFAPGWRLAAALALVASAVAAVAPGLAAEHPALQRAESGTLWKGPDGSSLPFQSEEEIIEFLQTARIESVTDIELGVTNPRRVVLVKDGVRMRAALRDYDETFTQQRFDGVFYARLRDSFVFDVPAYELALLLGLNNVPPVTFRRLGSNRVSLQAWLEGGLMETDRIDQGIDPPSIRRFRQQTQNMRVFDSLIGNVDRNTGNILMDGDWKFWLIDHSRAFMRNDDTRYLERIQACSRQLFERLKTLTAEEMLPVMSPPLAESEVNWVLRRRDKVAAHIDALIAEKGEGAVLFDDPR
ncbi:MAG: hypothetical protein IH849_13450 [Acidobacteria bacterium]|nr:hypothetical protein [Acidobacteriota bacterium]